MRVLRIMMMAVPVAGLGLATSSAHAAPAVPASYHATLAAAEEKPPGPAGGTGTAKVTIDGSNLCYDLTWSKEVGTPNAAHIHQGPAGTEGPIVVILTPTTAHTCTTAPPTVAQGIAGNPSGYYVNLHSNAYPGGAARGQLAAG